MIDIPRTRRKSYLRTSRILAVIAGLCAVYYLWWLLVDARADNPVLYWMLVSAELFNIVQAAGFWLTISRQRWDESVAREALSGDETVDLFVTVYGEPLDIVRRTVEGAMTVRHKHVKVWVLDDGGSHEVREMARELGAGYLHRPDRVGAKAGNLNVALAHTSCEYVAIFDADQIPKPEFLEVMLPELGDEHVAFVQSPQVYRDRFVNRVSNGAHDQQALFYGPILRGKNGYGATFSCGTNVVFRRSAVEVIGGFPEDSVTEDLRTSLLLLDAGYASAYVSTVLAEGLGPMTMQAFFDQQLRWCRGGLEILLRRKPFSRKMSAGQGLQYALGFLYWFTGWAYLVYLAIPTTYLIAGYRPLQVPNDYPAHFIPYVTMAMISIIYVSDFGVSFNALWFTLASFPVHVRALLTAITGRRGRFVVTPKVSSGGASLRPVRWHITACVVLASAIVIGLVREGLTPDVFNAIAWATGHLVVLASFIWVALNPLRSPAEALERFERERARSRADAPKSARSPLPAEEPEPSPSTNAEPS